MSDRERLIVDVVLAALLLLVPAFLLHSAPRFAGSLAGFALGASAAALMLLLLIYPLTKYSRSLKTLVTRLISMRTLLGVHVYAGIAASFLALLHTGHKYHSPLCIALIASMLVVVVTDSLDGITCRRPPPKSDSSNLTLQHCGRPTTGRRSSYPRARRLIPTPQRRGDFGRSIPALWRFQAGQTPSSRGHFLQSMHFCPTNARRAMRQPGASKLPPASLTMRPPQPVWESSRPPFTRPAKNVADATWSTKGPLVPSGWATQRFCASGRFLESQAPPLGMSRSRW